MRKATYTAAIILASAVFIGFIACSGGTDNSGSGTTVATGGASSTGGAGSDTGGAQATGGLSATGGFATGGMSATGGMAPVGGSSATGGSHANAGTSSTGGASAGGGNTSAGGTSGLSAIQQVCANDCTIMAADSTLSTQCPIPDCPNNCEKYYNVLAAVDPACSSAYLSVLTCGSKDPTGWMCVTSSGLTLPLPFSSCVFQLLTLQTALTANSSACQNALVAAAPAAP